MAIQQEIINEDLIRYYTDDPENKLLFSEKYGWRVEGIILEKDDDCEILEVDLTEDEIAAREQAKIDNGIFDEIIEESAEEIIEEKEKEDKEE